MCLESVTCVCVRKRLIHVRLRSVRERGVTTWTGQTVTDSEFSEYYTESETSYSLLRYARRVPCNHIYIFIAGVHFLLIKCFN